MSKGRLVNGELFTYSHDARAWTGLNGRVHVYQPGPVNWCVAVDGVTVTRPNGMIRWFRIFHKAAEAGLRNALS